uniref:C2H2-type domain-containing protein n=1 Tax=Panagrolaimus sp. ES5 TaxID=591445 RepID=A0AC34GGN1_9BILA
MASHMTSETRYSCIACPTLIFETYEHFESHIQLFHDKNDSSNGILNSKHMNGINNNDATLPSATTIIAGPSSKPLKCVVCDKECANELALDEHRLFNHCKVPKSDRCTVCRQNLTGISDFTSHMHLHSDGINDMDCIVCRQRIRNDSQIKMHAEYHLDLDEPTTTTSTTLSPNIITTKCSICNFSIPTSELAKHYLQHASSSGYLENGDIVKSEIFDDSRLQFPSTSEISSPSIPLICHCGQQFEDENELTVHALEHLNETLPGCSSNNNN